jgi:hypothetical protein
MKAKAFALTVIFAAALAAISFVFARAQDTADSYTCTGDFEAGIYSGPDKGLMLNGKLELSMDTGKVKGTFTGSDGKSVTVTGQAEGQAVNLAFQLGEKRYLFGVGTSVEDFSQCGGAAGGPLVGPQPGDSGDWGYAIGG